MAEEGIEDPARGLEYKRFCTFLSEDVLGV
jgi:hypothetical protein